MVMENFFRSKEYLQVVFKGIVEPADGMVVMDVQRTKIEKQQLLKNLRAKNYLFQAIDRSIFQAIDRSILDIIL